MKAQEKQLNDAATKSQLKAEQRNKTTSDTPNKDDDAGLEAAESSQKETASKQTIKTVATIETPNKDDPAAGGKSTMTEPNQGHHGSETEIVNEKPRSRGAEKFPGKPPAIRPSAGNKGNHEENPGKREERNVSIIKQWKNMNTQDQKIEMASRLLDAINDLKHVHRTLD